MNKHKVFVYGSLKKGFGNHRIIENSTFIGEAVTKDSDFQMISFGGFPGVVRRPEFINRVHGELYEVDDKALRHMDMLESNGMFYNRDELDFFTLSQPSMVIHTAWVYLLIEHHPEKCLEKSADVLTDRFDTFHHVQKWRKI